MKTEFYVQLVPRRDIKGDITGVQVQNLSGVRPTGTTQSPLAGGAHVVKVNLDVPDTFFETEVSVHLDHVPVDPTVAVRDMVALRQELAHDKQPDEEPF